MKMTPKEKAYDIFNKCCDYADYTDEDCCFTERETMYKNAKALSLIFVKEILEDRERLSDAFFYDLNYWIDVQKRIEEIEICENDVFKLPKKYTEKHLKEHALKFGCFLEKWQGGEPNIKVLESEVYNFFISTENNS